MEQLARALAPDARLVLIGDADQLPAVDIGSVFRDLVTAGRAVRLTQSHRMNPADPAGAAVLDAARAIAAGDLGGRGAPAVHAAAELPPGGFMCLEPEGATSHASAARCPVHRPLVCDLVRPGAAAARGSYARAPVGDDELEPERRPPDVHAARQQRSRLLTVTRAGVAGADRINADPAGAPRRTPGVGARPPARSSPAPRS